MVFVHGKTTPGLILGRVYNLPSRYLEFKWFEKAPEDAKVGDVIPQLSLEDRMPKSPKQPDVIPFRSDNSIPKSKKIAKMKFRGGKSSPCNYEVDKVYELSLRHARFPWFVLVE